MSSVNYSFSLTKGNEPECLTIEMVDRRKDSDGCVLADEDSFDGEPPLYFTEYDHFVSGVYMVCELRRRMCERFPDKRFKAAMLAEYSIINEEDMVEWWRSLDVEVRPQFKGQHGQEVVERSEAEEYYDALDFFAEDFADFTHGCGPFRSHADLMHTPKDDDDSEPDYEDDDFFDFIDTPLGKPSSKPMPSFKRIMKEIGMDELEGLEDIKAEFENIYCLCRLQRMRNKKHVKSSKALDRFHFLFTGNPGTGKTTVAQMLGKMFHRMGLLTDGTVHTHTRTDLVQRYIGATEEYMTNIIKESRGGVLFIDEAYALFDGRDDRGDFGNMVLQALLPVLTEDDPNLVIILAGYPAEMNKMLDSNPGLRSRFPFTLHFEDYPPELLSKIGLRKLSAYAFRAGEEESKLFEQMVDDCWQNRDPRNFANARFIDNAVYYIVLAAAKRLSLQSVSRLSKRALSSVTSADITAGFETFRNQHQRANAKRRQIGFAFSRS